MASKFVFSEEGTNTGSISFLSRARKSIHEKNSWWVKLSHVAPRRLFGSRLKASLMAYMQGSDTGGLVTGNLGRAAWMTVLRDASELPSNGLCWVC